MTFVKDHIGTIITLLTLLVTLTVAWATLSAKADQGVSNHAAQEIRLDRHEERIRALETSRALEEQINKWTNEIVELRTTVNALREEVREMKGKRR